VGARTIDAKMAAGVAGAIAALIAYLVVLNGGGNSIEKQIQKFADETNKTLPKQVDAITRWDRVEPGPGKSYSYVYTLSKQPTEQEKQTMTERVTRQALATPDLQATFAAGVTVWYKYYDQSGRKLLEFSVKK
jgi:hypothetical protein